ncbi:MAG TPA: hypothetical protein VGL94_16370 [Ktedonobacteraceae bacterium]|jgi:hypothetical protein
MRALSTTLTTALNAKTRRPAISLTAEDHIDHLAQAVAAANSDAMATMICVSLATAASFVSVSRVVAMHFSSRFNGSV